MSINSKCSANQIVKLMRRFQENVSDATDDFIEQILTEAVEENDLPNVVLVKWNKSKRDVIKAKKAARKAKRDPNAPKCPISAYMRFATCGVRESIKTANPDYMSKEIMSEIGLIWRQMNDGQKKPYIDAAEKDHAAYLELKKAYELEHPKPKRVKVTEATELQEDEFYSDSDSD